MKALKSASLLLTGLALLAAGEVMPNPKGARDLPEGSGWLVEEPAPRVLAPHLNAACGRNQRGQWSVVSRG
ncbi:MAG: hypothetical protein ABIP48_04900 [Planctomycetota bacterium]